ncbi:MAG: C25 family cysteine peptidase [Cyclobacteriaceae bacterium]
MKHLKLYTTIILLTITQQVIGQQFGNEWIDQNQQYYKVKIAEDGLYRITQQDLINSGVPVSTFDPRRIQLFYRGVEQAIALDGQQDGSFDSGDFIEFYGQRNDGLNETELYVDQEAQPHTKYSLFSDSSSYFLTWKLTPINGKRVTSFTENNVSGIPKEQYHLGQSVTLNTNNYSAGRTYSSGNVLLSQFDFGEGWTGSDIARGGSATFTLNLTNPVTSGPKPNIEITLVGRNNLGHNVDINVGPSTSSLRLLDNAQFSGHDIFTLTSEIEWTDVSAEGQVVIRVNVLGVDGAADRAAVSLIVLDYAQAADMESLTSKTFTLEANSSDKSFLEVINSPGNIRLYDVTNSNDIVRIGVNQTSSLFNAVVPLAATSRKLIATNSPSNQFKIEPVNFHSLSPDDYDFLIVSHKDLMAPTNSGVADPIIAYKNYRESVDGGSYRVAVTDVEILYDQFNYGEPSPLAIRRFVDFMLEGDAGYLFIIGEGLDAPKDAHRQTKEQLAASNLSHLIPTMGFPGSDIAILAGLKETEVIPPIPVGRITARTPDDVESYLNKIIETEANAVDELWHKQLVHLSGGTTPSELAVFRSNVDGFKAIAEDDFLGGQVRTVSKQSSSPIELFNLSDAVNDGVGLITFFGHSGPNGSDIDIGNPADPSLGYENKGRYTNIIVNGCNAGDVFGSTPSLGENWILTPDKGAVSFMAHSDNGLSSQLRRYCDQLYLTAYGDSLFIDKSVGNIQIEASRRFLENSGIGTSSTAQVQQFILQGDPSVKLFGINQPDYSTAENDVFFTAFDGGLINALTDSFAINVIVKNFGTTSKLPVSLTVNRTLGSGTVEVFGPQEFDPINFSDTLTMTIKSITGAQGFGNNTFEVIIDEANSIEENNELNNIVTTDFFISAGATINLFPKNFGIVSNPTVEFTAQSSDLLSVERSFTIEIDTTEAFNSPVRIEEHGDFKVLANWEIDLPILRDTTVYFWRSRFTNPRPDEDDLSTESSFTYLSGSEDGWAQSSFDQFDFLETNGVSKNEQLSAWEFEQSLITMDLKTHGTTRFPEGPVLYDSLSLLLNETEFLVDFRPQLVCRSNSINAMAFDKSSLFAYLIFGINTTRDSQKCGRTPFVINNILNNEIINGKLNTYIDGVADGDFVLLFSIGQVQYENWPQDVKDKVATLGVTPAFINTLSTGQPLIIVGKKGSAQGSAIAIKGASSETITLNDDLVGSFTTGSIKTPRIGPASSWLSFFNDVKISEIPQTDDFSFDILGVDLLGNENLIFDNINNREIDISGIDATAFPFLRLEMNIEDEVNQTAAQLNKWQVTFEGVTEGILLTTDEKVTSGQANNAQEGIDFETNYYFKNISSRNFADSIETQLTVFNQDLRTSEQSIINLPPIVAGDSAIFTYAVNTLGKSGINDLSIFVNPNLQPELTINNNILNLPGILEVGQDNINPILDVTFDGTYILDGDIVSPSPRILVRLKDENEFLFKQDTTGVNIDLKPPCESGCDFERVNFSNPDVSVTTASENTDFQVEYNPKSLEDGIYTLRVQAADASGNQSGTQPFQINFEVINESTITNFYPYPNPFSTSTRFVFTLTGSEIPDEIKIQIMTVSGRIVREITQDELGPIRIGNNLTDFAWDGTDEYGDQLANGVYLYRVQLRSNGQKLDRRFTSADRAFKNGFGKIYLLK